MHISRLGTLGLSLAALTASTVGLVTLQQQPRAITSEAIAPLARDVVQLDRSTDRTSDSAAITGRQASLNDQATTIRMSAAEISLSSTAKAAADAEAKRSAQAAAKAKAASDGYTLGTTAPKEIARQMALSKYGWGADQFECYNNIIMRESEWVVTADNPTSSAYGIPQALPGKRMASEGADWQTNPVTQIKWGLKYVKERFGTPCQAWAFKRANGWY